VPDNVSAATYDYVVDLVREYGQYPIDVADLDEDVTIG
jgi:hypothetical protein